MNALCLQLAEQILEGDGSNVTDEEHAARVHDLANDIQLAIDTWVATHDVQEAVNS